MTSLTEISSHLKCIWCFTKVQETILSHLPTTAFRISVPNNVSHSMVLGDRPVANMFAFVSMTVAPRFFELFHCQYNGNFLFLFKILHLRRLNYNARNYRLRIEIDEKDLLHQVIKIQFAITERADTLCSFQ